MKPEQALKIIDGIEEVRGDLPEDGLLVDEALIDAKGALKKQIPETPVWGYMFSDWIRDRMKKAGKGAIADKQTYCCPSCKESLGQSAFVKATHGRIYGDPFCKYCGQHISWENLPEENVDE